MAYELTKQFNKDTISGKEDVMSITENKKIKGGLKKLLKDIEEAVPAKVDKAKVKGGLVSSSGFNVNVDGFPFSVAFDNYNDKVVYCNISTPIGYFSARAKCHTEDKFDEVEGRRKALQRAVAKYVTRIEKNRKFVNKAFDRMVSDSFALSVRLERNAKHKAKKVAKKSAKKLVTK